MNTIKNLRFDLIMKILSENEIEKIYKDKDNYMISYKGANGKRMRLTIPLKVLGFTYRHRLKKVIDSMSVEIREVYDIDFKVRAL